MATTTSSASGILGQYEANQSATTNRVTSDKDMFLKLLIAQLNNQDPLNPAEDKEFIAQLAQFTQVEELQKISSGMETLNQNYLNQQVGNAVGFMGAYVSAKGDNVSLVAGAEKASPIYVEFPRNAESATFNVYATDDSGNPTSLVYSADLGATNAGTQYYEWPGVMSNGSRAPNGTYVVTVSATDADGQKMLVSTSSIGQVIGVETSADGNHYLILEDLRRVRLNDIDYVSYPPNSGEEEGENGNGEGGNGEGGTTPPEGE